MQTVVKSALALYFVTSGLVGAADPHPPARLNQAQVIRIANSEAHRAKLDLAHYHAPRAQYEVDGGVGRWQVSYETDTLDDCFWVSVDDRTHKALLQICSA
jgi:hypothetical protein